MKIKSTLLLISTTLCITGAASTDRLGGDGPLQPNYGRILGYNCLIDDVNHGETPTKDECMAIHDMLLEQGDLEYDHHDYILTEDGEINVETEDNCVVRLEPFYEL